MVEREKEKTEEKRYTFREGKEIIFKWQDRVLKRLEKIDERLEEAVLSVDSNSIPKTDETPNKPVNK